MGWENRDYHREDAGPRFSGPRFSSRLGKGSAVTWLLVANVVVFLLDSILSGSQRASSISPLTWGYFSVDTAVTGYQPWRFLSYQFLHADFFHLLFNMIGLYFFGPLMERWWGTRRFVAFYIICGIFGAIAYALSLAFIPGDISTPLIGASGCITGVVLGAAFLWPRQTVQLLFPPIPMKLWVMAVIFIGLDVLAVGAGSNQAGGAVAHLGGGAMGVFLLKIPKLLDWADRMSPAAIQRGVNTGRHQRKQKQTAAREAEVDRILDKVRDKGLNSLTRKEKQTLQLATDEKRGN